MGDVTYEDYQDLVRKLSLANERVRDFQERVSGRDARIAALEAQLAEARKALEMIDREATIANDVIRLNRDGGGQGRVKVATAMHRIAAAARRALTGGQKNG